jgi:signal transduction histidine kinase
VRIARELHDIVAHHMSVISLQAGLAQYVLDTDLPTARKAITTVGDTSREALTEMRRLLDVLRVDQDDDYRPQPGLAALDDLVERARSAGLPVDVVVTGDVRDLQPGPDLCAYRVAQESLTNVLKHAGPAKARIDVDYGEQTLVLKVTDDGVVDNRAAATHPSHGIRGMRERAELYGGVLTAGLLPEGGFGVVLRLPMAEVAAR